MNPALPQSAPGKWPSLALAALVHVLLLAFLFFGVRWQNPAPEAVEVSVVDGVPPPPRVAAPEPPPRPEPRPEPPKPEPKPEPKPVPKPEPKPLPPPPVKPEIVTKPEPVKKPPPPPPKPEVKPEPKPEPPKAKPEAKPIPKPEKQPDRMKEILAAEDKQRRVDDQKRQAAEQQRQLTAQLAAEESQRAAAKASAASKSALDAYMNKIRVKVRGNIILPPAVSGNPEAVFLVDQAFDGTVLEVRLKKSTGNAALDAAIEKAIAKSSPLPTPDDRSLFNRSLEFTVRPLDD